MQVTKWSHMAEPSLERGDFSIYGRKGDEVISVALRVASPWSNRSLLGDLTWTCFAAS